MKKIIYKKNPIIETILQLSFPKILELNSNEPIGFQEKIKGEFPIYNLVIEQQGEVTVEGFPDNLISSVAQKQKIKNHVFISKDGKHKVNLTSGYISFSTREYTTWEDFLKKFSVAYNSFLEIYNPPFFERIGLRYIDAISRKKLLLEGVQWRDLIKECWLGAYMIEEDENKVKNTGVDMVLMLDDGISRSRIHSGIGKINGKPENVFIFDVDTVHSKNIDIDSVFSVENYLHDNGKKMLNLFIKDKLHNAMEPSEHEE